MNGPKTPKSETPINLSLQGTLLWIQNTQKAVSFGLLQGGMGKHHQQNGQPKTTKKRDTNQPLPSGCLPMDAREIMDLVEEKQNNQKARLPSFGLLQGGMGKHHQQNGQPKTTKKRDTNQPLPSGCLPMDARELMDLVEEKQNNQKARLSSFGLLQGGMGKHHQQNGQPKTTKKRDTNQPLPSGCLPMDAREIMDLIKEKQNNQKARLPSFGLLQGGMGKHHQQNGQPKTTKKRDTNQPQPSGCLPMDAREIMDLVEEKQNNQKARLPSFGLLQGGMGKHHQQNGQPKTTKKRDTNQPQPSGCLPMDAREIMDLIKEKQNNQKARLPSFGLLQGGMGKHHQQNGQPKTTKKRDTNQPLSSGCLPMDAREIMDLIKEKQNTQKARLPFFGLLQGGMGKHHQQNGQPKTTKKRDTNQPLPSGCLPMDAREIMDLIKEKQNNQKARLPSFGLLQGGMGKHH